MRNRLFRTPPRNADFFPQGSDGLRRRSSEKSSTKAGLNDKGFSYFPRETHGVCCGDHGLDDEEDVRGAGSIIHH